MLGKSILVMLVTVGLPLAGYIVAKKKKKWVGFVVPLLFFGLSLNSAYFMNQYLHTLPEADPVFIRQMTVLTFDFANIPTLVALLICLIAYWKRRRDQRLSEHDDLRDRF